MNKSYSKIRHILEANQKLERRMLLDKGLLTENRSSYNSRNLLFEREFNPASATMADVMEIQEKILEYELSQNVATYDGPDGCYQGNTRQKCLAKSNCCKIKGSSLCGGGECVSTVTRLVDGVFGPNTRAAYEANKGNITLADEQSDYTQSLYGQQIPVTQDQVRAFQEYVWTKETPDGQTEVASILCGGSTCTKERAVDGAWGGNTKKAWGQYGDEYIEEHPNFS